MRHHAPPRHGQVLISQVLHELAVEMNFPDLERSVPWVPDEHMNVPAQLRVLGMELLGKRPAFIPGVRRFMRHLLVRTEEGQIHPLVAFEGGFGRRERQECATGEKKQTEHNPGAVHAPPHCFGASLRKSIAPLCLFISPPRRMVRIPGLVRWLPRGWIRNAPVRPPRRVPTPRP